MDPENGEELTADDIVEIKPFSTVYRPRNFSESSLPGLLTTFQNEWDALVLELCTLRKEYENLAKDLSQSKLKNEAATRVVARLIKERDEALYALSQLKASTQYGVDQAVQSKKEPQPTQDATAKRKVGEDEVNIQESHSELEEAKPKRTPRSSKKVKSDEPTEIKAKATRSRR